MKTAALLTLLSLLSDPLLHQALYETPKRMFNPRDIAPSGAVALNAKWEAGESSKWYIELQRFCSDMVEAGVATRDDSLIQDGLKVLKWGFLKQGSDGSFPGTNEPFHSTSLFVDGAARALLLLRQMGDPRYVPAIEEYSPKLRKAAQWLTRPDVESKGKKNNAPFTHRYYVLAAALGEVSALTQDKELARIAAEYAKEGLSKQTPEGVNPEKGGYDVSYQMVGILHAEHYYTTLDYSQDDALCQGLRQMITRGLDWEMQRVLPTGEIEIGASTRLEPGAKGRSGKQKGVNYKEVLEAFVYGAILTGKPQYHAAAERIARYKKWVR